MSDIIRMALIATRGSTFYGNGVNSDKAARAALNAARGALEAAKSGTCGFEPSARITVLIFDYTEYDRITWENSTVTGHKPSGEAEVIHPIEILTLTPDGVVVNRLDTVTA